MTGLDREVTRRTVRTGALLAAAACGAFAVLYGHGGPREFVALNGLAGLLMAVLAFLPRRLATLQLWGVVTAASALLASELLLAGRLHGGVLVWCLIPVLGSMLIGARLVAVWSAALSVAAAFWVVVAERLNLPIVGHVELPDPDFVLAMSILGCMVVMSAMAAISLRTRHRLVRALEARNAELAQALAQAETARSAAIEAAEAKERFFANLTHEIRTPLNGIAGTAELLNAAPLPDEERAIADALVASTRGLVTLVNTMLAHARLRAQRVELERGPVAPRAVAADVEALFRAQAADKNLLLVVAVDDAVPPWVETDGVKLGQVIGNLVGNAVKFTDRGRVVVTFAYRPAIAAGPGPACGRLSVGVADTGVGIPADLASEIFEPFVQGDASMTRAHGGTGLGLAIASQLTEILGGTLSVRSVVGQGSTFTLDMPVATAAPPAVAALAGRPVEARTGPRVRVLLAEDNDVNRIVASRMLGKLGADVMVAEDGTRAVELARDGGVGLILMDLQMPGLDGISAAREIRRWESETGAARARILAMTGNAPEDYADACAAAGMDGFVTKPVDMAQMRELLDPAAR